ncbi:MAG: PQQ-dependent sugar dehydrogenase [Gemmatimonadetes bacterium]|nr:PQQ-dependent sugar dehydrogenase [Gemmatimonadota bacterium]
MRIPGRTSRMPLSALLLAILACGGEDGGGPSPSNVAPVAQITSPAPGDSAATGDVVVLRGGAIDAEDGALSGSSLAWFSSLNGSLGTGDSLEVNTLLPGTHVLTLEATDSRGKTGSATVSLLVTGTATGLGLVEVTHSLSEPVFLTHAPGDSTRLFVVEKDGRIRIIKNGVLLPTPFLDLTDSTTKGSEQGLLGLAFAPDYATSGRFFVSYTSPRGSGGAGRSVIARYQVSAASPDVADPASGHNILLQSQPYSNHNGGMIAFGPDGYLYVGFGDGGGGGDPLDTGQDASDFLGSLLRLDVSGSDYTIPPTNPFAASGSLAHEVWNYGLRNPWRFSFDRTTGDLYIGDVGQGEWEEIDVRPATSTGGENFGWNEMEGMVCYQAGCSTAGKVLPLVAYDHSSACAVTGGYVYRGSALPALRGHYLYADYCGGWVRSFQYVGGQAINTQDRPELEPGGLITSFGEDAAGELYILTQGGSVFRIVPK